jgi:hypothetical protein
MVPWIDRTNIFSSAVPSKITSFNGPASGKRFIFGNEQPTTAITTAMIINGIQILIAIPPSF